MIAHTKRIRISGSLVDQALLSYAKRHKSIVATVDIELKRRIRQSGGSIISVANDKIVLEPSKI